MHRKHQQVSEEVRPGREGSYKRLYIKPATTVGRLGLSPREELWDKVMNNSLWVILPKGQGG